MSRHVKRRRSPGPGQQSVARSELGAWRWPSLPGQSSAVPFFFQHRFLLLFGAVSLLCYLPRNLHICDSNCISTAHWALGG